MSIGQKIMDAVIQGNLVSAKCVESGEHNIIFVWSSAAEEQLEALVSDHYNNVKPQQEGPK
jgi:hypothetical protein